MESLGANNKKLKGKKEKIIVGMTDMFRNMAGVIMVQLEQRPTVNAKEGIKRYGEKAVHAILFEYGQIDNMGTFQPLDINKMTREEKWQVT